MGSTLLFPPGNDIHVEKEMVVIDRDKLELRYVPSKPRRGNPNKIRKKLIVAGSRGITDPYVFAEAVSLVEDYLNFDSSAYTTVLNGKCPVGVDWLALKWADKLGKDVEAYPAEWKEYGRSAGPMRNKEMARNADALLLIWDGESKGSRSMLYHALKEGIEVFEVKVREWYDA